VPSEQSDGYSIRCQRNPTDDVRNYLTLLSAIRRHHMHAIPATLERSSRKAVGCNMQSQANHNRYVIDVSKPWHVAWWAKELGVSEDSLLDAIHRVGVEVGAVEAYIGTRSARDQDH
jgi:hypothetical protein